LHVVVPATVAATSNLGDVLAQTHVAAEFELPLSTESFHAQFVDFDTGPPPNDLVVKLHRLII
jgi:hypothetical protein